MKIIADEHIPPAFVSALRSMGYDVEAVGDTVRLGAEDQNILACDTGANPGDIAAAIQEIDRVSDQLNDSIIFIPKNWI